MRQAAIAILARVRAARRVAAGAEPRGRTRGGASLERMVRALAAQGDAGTLVTMFTCVAMSVPGSTGMR